MAKNIAPVPADGSAPAGAGKVVNASGAPSKNTKLMPKKHGKAVNPALSPAGAPRVYAPKERNGAQYGIQVGFEAHVAPEAGFTQANGRILPTAINRSAPNFQVGMSDHN
jgi:hypothetical protein